MNAKNISDPLGPFNSFLDILFISDAFPHLKFFRIEFSQLFCLFISTVLLIYLTNYECWFLFQAIQALEKYSDLISVLSLTLFLIFRIFILAFLVPIHETLSQEQFCH